MHKQRSPVPAIAGSLAAGLLLALALLIGPAAAGSEPVITGSVLLAFGLGWGLMRFLSTRFSSQPQSWLIVPAAFLSVVGLGLIVLQPGPAAMDLLSWVWPPALGILAVWMLVQVRQQLHGRGRWLVVPVIATLLVLAIGGGVASIAATTKEPTTSAGGQLIDVGGHRLYIECTGSGGPAVVLQAGLGGTSSDWGLIAPAIAAQTRVCVYDRAGHGRSDDAAGPQDGIAIATDLHTLRERAGNAGPYVLVGHSSGGPYMRVFAARYPEEVAGMVLVDAQPADAFTALPTYPGTYEGLLRLGRLSPSLARVGILGLLFGVPPEQATPAIARASRDEFIALPAALQQAQALTTLDDRPLIVVTAGSGQQEGWQAAQDQMVGLSTNSVHRNLANATHDTVLIGADASASSQAVLDVLEAVRAGSAVR